MLLGKVSSNSSSPKCQLKMFYLWTILQGTLDKVMSKQHSSWTKKAMPKSHLKSLRPQVRATGKYFLLKHYTGWMSSSPLITSSAFPSLSRIIQIYTNKRHLEKMMINQRRKPTVISWFLTQLVKIQIQFLSKTNNRVVTSTSNSSRQKKTRVVSCISTLHMEEQLTGLTIVKVMQSSATPTTALMTHSW